MKRKRKTTKQFQIELEPCDKIINTYINKNNEILKTTIKQIIKDTKNEC